jgi:hypothetical protein
MGFERETLDDDDVRTSRTVRWHEGEFLRIVADDDSVAVVWSTRLALNALVEAVAADAVIDSEADAAYTFTEGGADEISYAEAQVSTVLRLSAAGESVLTAQIPFRNFWLWWSLQSATAPGLSEASISYSRDDLSMIDPKLVARTGTPDVQTRAPQVLGRYHRLEII